MSDEAKEGLATGLMFGVAIAFMAAAFATTPDIGNEYRHAFLIACSTISWFVAGILFRHLW